MFKYTPRSMPDVNAIPMRAKVVISALDRKRDELALGSPRERRSADRVHLLAAADIAAAVEDFERRAVCDAVEQTLAEHQREYVRALNAVLAAADGDSPDAHRWRGHAEAHRASVEALCARYGMSVPPMGSQEWREKHGVYTAGEVENFRRR